MFHTNIRSLYSNFEFIDVSFVFDYIVITETWCKDNFMNVFKMSPYFVFPFKRLDTHEGGGICIFIKDT